jgi:hypothetical protein
MNDFPCESIDLSRGSDAKGKERALGFGGYGFCECCDFLQNCFSAEVGAKGYFLAVQFLTRKIGERCAGP